MAVCAIDAAAIIIGKNINFITESKNLFDDITCFCLYAPTSPVMVSIIIRSITAVTILKPIVPNENCNKSIPTAPTHFARKPLASAEQVSLVY